MGICTSKNELLKYSINQNLLTQIGRNLCKMNLTNDTTITGFFCKIPVLSKSKCVTVLIISDILDITQNKSIQISFKDFNGNKIEKNLLLNKSRLIYTNDDINITFLEILPNDGIDTSDFLELDETISLNNKIDIFKEQAIYILLFSNDQSYSVSYIIGKIKDINKQYITYDSTINNFNSKASGLPILLLSNNKVIGINKKENQGVFIKYPVEAFNIMQNDKKVNLYLNNCVIENKINMIEMTVENYEENEIDEDNNIFRICNYIENSITNNSRLNNINVNKSFIEVYINNNIYNYKNFTKPPKGILNIKIIINYLLSDCRNLFVSCCKNLISLNLSSFDCRNVNNMSYMFRNCEKLISINFANFDTKNATNMGRMFMDCKNLKNLDLSNFDTTNVKKMSYMFHGCENLTNLNLSNFNTINVKEMNDMFHGCKNLVDINISSFNTKNVTNMSRMFMDCSKLTNLNLSFFDTESVTNMSRMFMNCKNLVSLNLASFNTINVTDINRIFFECDQLQNLNIALFELKNDANILYMFNGCKNLKEVYVSSKINCNNVISQLKSDGIQPKIIYL